MLYWLPGTGASSARLYWESFNDFARSCDPVDGAGRACSIFPKEIIRPSRRWAERRFTDIRYWNELDRGGHFAAFEQPEVFVDEVRSFFRHGALTVPRHIATARRVERAELIEFLRHPPSRDCS